MLFESPKNSKGVNVVTEKEEGSTPKTKGINVTQRKEA